MAEQLDPEMLKNLEFLVDYDAVEEEPSWEVLENLDETEAAEESHE